MSQETTLKPRITEDMKSAMRNKDKERLGVIRLILAAIKQIEVDERIELDDTRVLAVLDKMVKQRRDSIEQYQAASRTDLVEQEVFELNLIQEYLPAALSESEIEALIADAMAKSGASSAKEMGAVMGILKPQMQGRADMGQVSKQVKAKLAP